MAISEALNAGAVYSDLILRMDKFDESMKSVQNALKKADAQIDQTKKRLDLTAVAEKMKSTGAMMSLAFTAPLAIMGGLSIKAASDLDESANKAKVVFGEAIGVIDDLAKTSAQSLGISKQQAYESAGTFGNLFVAMGITQDKAAGMSTGILKLGADLASFNNIKPEEALEKLRAGLVGEAEPLRTLGVNLSAVAVEARAMSMAHKSSAAQLTTADKAMASYALILEQTQTAQGDFARTSDGLANSQRILKAEIENQSASIGAALLPAYSSLLSIVGELVSWFGGLSDGTKDVIIVIAGMVATIGPLLLISAKLITTIRTISSVFKGMEIAAKMADLAAKVFSTTARTLTISAGGLVGVLSVVIGLLMTSKAEAQELDDVMNSTEGMKKAAEEKAKLAKQFASLSENGRNLIRTFGLIGDENKIDVARTQSLTGELSKLERQYAGLDSKKREIINNGYYEGQDKDLSALSEERRGLAEKIGLIKAAQAEVLKLAKSQQAAAPKKKEQGPVIFTPPKLGAGGAAKDEAEEFRKAWKSALDLTSTDFMAKFGEIEKYQKEFGASWQTTGMTIAAGLSSAFAAVGNVITSIFSYQRQMIEKQYGETTEAEDAYNALQEQQDAKSYAKMSAKEKKEYNLKKAADKAREEQEAKKNKKLEALQKEQTAFSLVQSIAQIGMSTAMGIMEIWSKWASNPPVAIGLTAMVSALAAAQVAAATIAAAPAMATGGLVKSRSGGSQIVAGEAGYDEWVVPDTDKVMNGIASRLNRMQNKQGGASSATDEATSGTSLGERLVARVTAPFNVDGISFGNAIIDVFDKGYAHIGQNRVVPA